MAWINFIRSQDDIINIAVKLVMLPLAIGRRLRCLDQSLGPLRIFLLSVSKICILLLNIFSLEIMLFTYFCIQVSQRMGMMIIINLCHQIRFELILFNVTNVLIIDEVLWYIFILLLNLW